MKTYYRYDLINHVISKYGFTKYLEIGVGINDCFEKIKIQSKESVDPEFPATHAMTSDQFFEQLPVETKYDVIFIDGLHLKEQVVRDVDNSLKHLNPGGLIFVHDCNPTNEDWVTPYWKKGAWLGTVWEAIVELRMSRGDLSICVVDTDYGCGFVKIGNQQTLPRQEVNYKLLDSDRVNLLNLISVNDFFKIA